MTNNVPDKVSDASNNRATNPRKRRMLIILGSFVFGLCVIYCCGLPYVTGQACLDFMSGQVPAKAEDIFFQRVFEAVVNEDYEWLATVTTDHALLELKELQPKLSNKYEIIWGDDLAGEYERVLLFDNGTKVYLAFWGSWSSCPDFNVTEKETFEKIELFVIEEEVD